MSWGHRHQIKKAVQSSINTVDYTTNEDERQNCISDIVNNLNNVDKHVDDPYEVEGLNVEETIIIIIIIIFISEHMKYKKYKIYTRT